MLLQTDRPLGRYVDVLRVLTVRHVKVRYRGSALGIAWSLINPAIMAIVYAAVFGHSFAPYYQHSTWHYVVAVFIGLVVNGFFATSTAMALRAVVDNGGLISKVRVALGVFPASLMLASCVQLVVGAIPVLLIITLLAGHNVLGIALLPVPLLSLVMIALGTSYLLSALYVFFRDVPYMYDLVLFATWVAAPVFYPLEIVGVQFRKYIALNPLTQIMESLRDVALRHTMPSAFALIEPFATGLLLCGIGYAVFRALKPKFMDFI